MSNETGPTKQGGIDKALFQNFMERADAGDEATLPLIRFIQDAMPDRGREFGGDLAYVAEQALIREYAKANLWLKEALSRKMEQLRTDLAGPSPSPLERLLVERVALCWLHTYFVDLQYAAFGNVSPVDGEYLHRQQDRTQRRYVAALKCLATVRRLALPVKVDVTVAASVDSQPRPACRRPIEAEPPGASSSERRSIAPKRGKRVTQTPSQ
jgi:hypothetical protein